jgi:hypothetical protein
MCLLGNLSQQFCVNKNTKKTEKNSKGQFSVGSKCQKRHWSLP